MKGLNNPIGYKSNQTLENPFIMNPFRFAAAGSLGSWKEVGRTTLVSTSDNITVSSLPNKQYYMCLANTFASGNSQSQIQMGNGSVDTSSIYADRFENNGAADSTQINQGDINISDTNSTQSFEMGYISNLSAQEKLWQGNNVLQKTAGAGTAPSRTQSVGKYAYTSNPIDVINWFNRQAGNFNTGSELVILGYDPTDTHTDTDNFWQELASVELGGTSTNLSSGTITAKKYLWFQAYIKPIGGAVTHRLSFNNDGGTNYSDRYSSNGGADSTNRSGVNWNLSGGITASSLPSFHNYFVINNSANDKLVTGNNIFQGTAGAGTAPQRMEFTGKWSNTSSQVTEIDFDADGGNSFAATSIIKVWGHD